jgi:hypothetical protein
MLDLSRLRDQLDAFQNYQAETLDRRTRQQERAAELLHALRPRWTEVRDTVDAAQPKQLVARMREAPTTTVAPPERPETVTVVATDGSQIYPDRHVEPTYFLLNVSRIALQYGTTEAPTLDTEPDLRFRDDLDAHFDEALASMTTEVVSALRDEMELRELLNVAREAFVEGRPLVALADGTLIRWMIRGMHNRAVEKRLIASYTELLQGFASDRLPLCSYISMPGNTEVVNLLRFDADELAIEAETLPSGEPTLAGLLDRTVFGALLDAGERSALFRSPSRIQREYAAGIQICYFYLKVPGSAGEGEIARVEIPAWLADAPAQVDLVHSVVLDECRKGDGYPVALAEAHEHAVIRAPEREAFLQLMDRRLRRAGLPPTGSQKRRSKRTARV